MENNKRDYMPEKYWQAIEILLPLRNERNIIEARVCVY